MSEVIVVTSGKGGVGKTITTANLGVGLARLGKKVVLLDSDIGLRNLDIALGLENSIVYDFVDIITGTCELDKAIIKDKRYDGLFFIPAAQLKSCDSVTTEQMKELCEKLREKFDFVIIDCPTGIETGFLNAIAAADKALVVTVPETASVRDSDRVVGLLEENGIREHYVLINRIRPDLVKRGDMMSVEDVTGSLKIDLIGVVPEDTAVFKSKLVVGETKSAAGKAYRNIAERLIGNNVPIMKLKGKCRRASR